MLRGSSTTQPTISSVCCTYVVQQLILQLLFQQNRGRTLALLATVQYFGTFGDCIIDLGLNQMAGNQLGPSLHSSVRAPTGIDRIEDTGYGGLVQLASALYRQSAFKSGIGMSNCLL